MGKLSKRLNNKIIFKHKSNSLLNQLHKEKVVSKNKIKPKSEVSLSHNVDTKLSFKIINQAKAQLLEIDPNKNAANNTKGLIFENDGFDCMPYISGENNHMPDSKDIDDFDKYMNVLNKNAKILDDITDVLTEKRTELISEVDEDLGTHKNLNPQIIKLYKDIGVILSNYRSGKVPKAFKIVPSLENWEEILSLTNPDQWTAGAMYQATKFFSSNLNAKLAQRFYHKILLPRIRDDIAEFKKLNYHLYQALYKSMYKPGAFFKGIIIPLCETTLNRDMLGNTNVPPCSLREAFILGTVLQKNSIPILHASATILKLIELSSNPKTGTPEYSGPIAIFLKILIEKQYDLPIKVLEALSSYFLEFQASKQVLPVLWHQALLSFVQNYSNTMTEEDKAQLRLLTKSQKHHIITPLIINSLSDNTDAIMKESE